MVTGYRLTAFSWHCFKLSRLFSYPSIRTYVGTVLERRLGKDTTQPSYPCKLSSAHPVTKLRSPALYVVYVLSYIGIWICTRSCSIQSCSSPYPISTGKRQAVSLTKSQNAKKVYRGLGFPFLNQRMMPNASLPIPLDFGSDRNNFFLGTVGSQRVKRLTGIPHHSRMTTFAYQTINLTLNKPPLVPSPPPFPSYRLLLPVSQNLSVIKHKSPPPPLTPPFFISGVLIKCRRK